VVYRPPGTDGKSISDHLFQSLLLAESQYPNCGIIVAGDFNKLDVSYIQRHFKLKQLVKAPTRGQATLDLILINLSELYSQPEITSPFGLSDHNTVSVVPKVRTPRQASKKSITVRDTRTSKKNSLGRYLNSIDWSVINVHDECETKYDMFTKLVKFGLDNIMPEKTLKVYPTDVPWMTTKLKDLIRLRQLAFHADRNSFRF
jgi:hypothetical protein